MRKASVLVVVWVVSMLAAGMWAYAQAPLPPAVPRSPQSGLPSEAPTVISGSDLGFRVENRRGNTVVGRFVVRVNGRWLEIQESSVVKRLTQR
jgi:hypothetical protein